MISESALQARHTRNLLFLLMGVALVARIAVTLFVADNRTLYYEYMEIARNLLQGLGFSYNEQGGMPMQPTSLFPPLYVYWCALFMKICPTSFLPMYSAQAIIGASGVLPSYILGKRFFSQRVGIWLAGMYAVYPEMVFLCTRPVPEFLYVVVFLWLLVFYSNLNNILLNSQQTGFLSWLCGMLAGFGVLIKSTVLLQITAISVALFIAFRREWRRVLRILWPVATMIILFVAPWTIRNYIVQDRIIILRTGFGMNLWMGNNPISIGTTRDAHGEKVRFSTSPELGENFQAHLPPDEQNRDDFYRTQAINYIRSHPGHYARLCLNRLWYFIWFDPNHPLSGNLVYRVSYLLLAVLGITGAIRLWKQKRLDFVLPITYLLYMSFYIPVISLPRYRIIPVIILMILAAYAFQQMAAYFLRADRGTEQARII